MTMFFYLVVLLLPYKMKILYLLGLLYGLILEVKIISTYLITNMIQKRMILNILLIFQNKDIQNSSQLIGYMNLSKILIG